MPALPIIATVGAIVGSSLIASNSASRAADAQTAAADAGIEEQRRQFDQIQQTLSPFVDAGSSSIGAMLALSGGAGDDAYRAAVQSVESSPEFTSLIENGEEAILANASATGGLRGGNTAGALAQFRPEILRQSINDRFNRLSGISQIGQASAAGQASAGLATGNSIAGLLGQAGAAQAGGAIAQGNAFASGIGDLAAIFGGGGFGGGFGGTGGFGSPGINGGTF